MKEKEGEEYQPAGAIAGGHGGVAGSRSDLNKHFSLRGAVAATGSKGGGECSTLTTAWPVASHRVGRQLLGCSLAVKPVKSDQGSRGRDFGCRSFTSREENYFPWGFRIYFPQEIFPRFARDYLGTDTLCNEE